MVISDTGEPVFQARYSHGRRQGVLKAWGKAGEPNVFVQYSKGKPHGFGLLFDEGQVRMIVEYDHDTIKGIQIIEDFKPSRAFASAAEAEDDEPTRQLLERLADGLAEVKLTEAAARKELAAARKQQQNRDRSEPSRDK